MKKSWPCLVAILTLALWALPLVASSQQIEDATASMCEGVLSERSSTVSAQAGRHGLCHLIEVGRLDDLKWPDFQEYREQLFKLYLLKDFDLLWVSGNQLTPQSRAVINSLQQADREGLDPDDYDGPRWQQRVERVLAQEPILPEDLARFDLALTISVMRYIADLHNGRVRSSLHFGLETKEFNVVEYLHDRLLRAIDVDAAMRELEPRPAGYWRTKKALGDYLALVQEGEGESIPMPDFPLKPGDSYSGTASLRERLKRFGDLPKDAVDSPPNIYGGALVAAVKHFQRRHGLDPDGRLTKETYDQLSTPLSRRVTQLQLTLERWRWLPDTLESPFIVVNIPEFRLRAYDNHHATFAMKAIVGEAPDHETPVFADRLEAVVFRPYWNVPESIVRTELVPELRKRPHYLPRHHMEIVNRRGDVITTDLVDAKMLRQLQSGALMLRQQPGPANALGLVKFVFPNQYSIYMHGTPERGLFSLARRDLSHGCIRVENPAALAAWVLRDVPAWTPGRINTAMRGNESIEVKLPHGIPILILYGTARVEESGEVRFFNDIYGLDASLTTALEHRHDQLGLMPEASAPELRVK